MELTILEALTKGMLEAFLMILAIHGICGKRIETKKYILSALILNIETFAVRMLPINFGVHIVFNLMCLIFICTKILKENMFDSTKGALIVTLILFITESINIVALQMIYGDRFIQIINDPISKIITSLPCTFMFGVVAIICYKISMNKIKVN